MRDREQKLIDIMFEIALTLGEKTPDYSREQVVEWVAKQLRGCGFDTRPVGLSWGVLVPKENELKFSAKPTGEPAQEGVKRGDESITVYTGARLRATQVFPVDMSRESANMLAMFFDKVTQKFSEAERKHNWGDAWITADENDLRKAMIQHWYKGDPRDVAIYCAMFSYHGWPTLRRPDSPVKKKGVDNGGEPT